MFEFLFKLIANTIKSKTLIAGWITFAAGLLSFLTGSDFIQQFPEVTSVLVAVSGVVSMVLRYVTTLPLELKD